MHATQIDKTLEWLIAPAGFNAFAERHWGLEPLRIARGDSEYYETLLSEKDLEHALYAACKSPGAVQELNDDQRPREFRDHAAAQQSFREGKSLRINAVQRFSREILALCRSLEQDFSFPVNVNLYLTPGATRAIGRHYDSHDVLVLQVRGKKKWRIFDSPVASPMEYLPPLRCEPQERMKSARIDKMRDTTGRDRCALAEEFVLSRGDFLYLPRGFWHEAEAEPDQASCHLTVGIQALTYVDLVSVAVAAASRSDARLREALPLGFATHSDRRAEAAARMAEIAPALAASLDADFALEEVAEMFLASRTGMVTGLLGPDPRTQTGEVELETPIAIRDGAVCGVWIAGDEVRFTYESRAMILPADFEAACRFIARRRRFTAAELPGALSDAERRSLVERLILDGLLVRA